MELLDVIDDILDQDNVILPVKTIDEFISKDEFLFNKIANFIINLEPDSLQDEYVQEVLNIIEFFEGFDVDEVKRARLAKRTPSTKNQYSKKWYRVNKTSIKRRKAKFRRSSQGRKRDKMKERLNKIGKTATGRKKVRYHTRKKSKEEKGENKK